MSVTDYNTTLNLVTRQDSKITHLKGMKALTQCQLLSNSQTDMKNIPCLQKLGIVIILITIFSILNYVTSLVARALRKADESETISAIKNTEVSKIFKNLKKKKKKEEFVLIGKSTLQLKYTLMTNRKQLLHRILLFCIYIA